ncbi:hypothetical protein BC940DRAFT_309953 [Gongronella butleri]|nr:hypothetical protein BC940DRAFT_309953 [Gongronella butleri]
MVGLLDLPIEVLLQVLGHCGDMATVDAVLASQPRMQLKYAHNESFWHDISRLFGRRCLCPGASWCQFTHSQEFDDMCPHLDPSLAGSHLVLKQCHAFPAANVLATEIMRNNAARDNHVAFCYICLDPDCDFVVRDPSKVREHRYHPIGIKTSLFHFFELWCAACERQLGTYPRIPTEAYWARRVIHAFVDPTHAGLRQYRRRVETSLRVRPGLAYLVSKPWHDAWLAFLHHGGDPPGRLDNTVLYDTDRHLRPCMQLHHHFAVVNNATRYYIERIYGVKGEIPSKYALFGDPTYCIMLAQIDQHEQELLTSINMPLLMEELIQ